jgi:hypothetical protein
MAQIQHLITTTWQRSGESIPVTVTIEDGGEVNITEPLAAPVTNYLINIAVDVSELSSLLIYSDVACTIKTNSSGSPDNTITVAAGKPVVWYTGCGLACPLTVDVTKIYVTVGGSTAGTLKIRALQDATP